jgi:hypothetical protein
MIKDSVRLRRIGSRRRFAFDLPQVQVLKDFFHELIVLDERDNAIEPRHLEHTNGLIRLRRVDFLNQARPVLTEFFG